MRKETLKGAKAKCWKALSLYVRTLEKGICFTCGVQKPITEMDAGHYHARTAGLSTFFNLKNVHCQCTFCNRFKHGNLPAYALALIAKYGPNILEELDAERRKIKKYSVIEYQELTKHYTELLNSL